MCFTYLPHGGMAWHAKHSATPLTPRPSPRWGQFAWQHKKKEREKEMKMKMKI